MYVASRAVMRGVAVLLTGMLTGAGCRAQDETGFERRGPRTSARANADTDTRGHDAGTPEPEPEPVDRELCVPEADGPTVVLEAETLELSVKCTTEMALPGDAFELEPLPEGASFDPASATLAWTPHLGQSGLYRVQLRVPSLDERAELQIRVIDRFDDPGNAPVDPMTYDEEYGLPVFHLGLSPEINDDEHTPATLVYRGHDYAAFQAKYRGNTSLRYPKRSYTLKFSEEDEFNEPAYGFSSKRRIVLTSTFDDNSYLRQRLAYELWNRMSPDHIQIRVYSAVVFVNGQYHGLYVVSDHIDDELMAANGLEKDGNLYKARTHNADFRLIDDDGTPKNSPHLGYTKEEGVPAEGEPDAFADLDQLVTWISTASDEEFHDGVDARMARSEFEAWWIFVTAIEATDSAGKNHYLYHDPSPDAEDPRFHYIPWDFNASFGQNWRTARTSPIEGFNVLKRNHVFERLLAEPRFAEPLYTRFDDLLHTVYAVDEVLALFDTWGEEIDASARRDEQKWGSAYLEFDWGNRADFTDYAQETEYVREWIRAHWADLDAMY